MPNAPPDDRSTVRSLTPTMRAGVRAEPSNPGHPRSGDTGVISLTLGKAVHSRAGAAMHPARPPDTTHRVGGCRARAQQRAVSALWLSRLLQFVRERPPCGSGEAQRSTIAFGGVADEHSGIIAGQLYALSAASVAVSGLAPVAHVSASLLISAVDSDTLQPSPRRVSKRSARRRTVSGSVKT